MPPERDAHLFGVSPPPLVAGLAFVLLVAALVLLVSGSLVSGLALLALGLVFGALFAEGVRRRPRDPFSSFVLARSRSAGSYAGFTGRSLSAWWGARRELAAIKRGLRALAAERRDELLALGEASYRRDADETESHRERIRRVDERIAELEGLAAEAIAAFQRELAGERLAIQPTERLERKAAGRREQP